LRRGAADISSMSLASHPHLRPLLLAATLLLAGCDQLGIEAASAVAARREGEGKAVGGACRHAGRAIEDCYAQNKKADKAAVFAGWREMNDYMRENKIEAVAPQPGGDKSDSAREEVDKPAEKVAAKGADKPGQGDRVAKK
jgi:hypothetical protein